MGKKLKSFFNETWDSIVIWCCEPLRQLLDASSLEKLWILFYLMFSILPVCLNPSQESTPGISALYGLLWAFFSAYLSSKQPYIFSETKHNITSIRSLGNGESFETNVVSDIIDTLKTNALLSIRTLFAITFFLIGIYLLNKNFQILSIILVLVFAYRTVLYTIKSINFDEDNSADDIRKQIDIKMTSQGSVPKL